MVVGNAVDFVQSAPAVVLVQSGSGAVQSADNFSNRISINPLLGPVMGNNQNATSEPGEPLHDGKPGGKSIWYTWQASFTGVISLTTQGQRFRHAPGRLYRHQRGQVDAGGVGRRFRRILHQPGHVQRHGGNQLSDRRGRVQGRVRQRRAGHAVRDGLPGVESVHRQQRAGDHAPAGQPVGAGRGQRGLERGGEQRPDLSMVFPRGARGRGRRAQHSGHN